MKTSVFTSISLGVLFFAFSLPVAAEGPVIRSGDTVTIESSQKIEGDFYGMGENITVSGEALHDVYALGAVITINAPVREDLTVGGGTVQVHGDVGDDIRVLGGEIVIANPVADDIVVLGGKVHILSTASVGGDLIFLGGDVRVDGPVEGAVYGAGESIRIDGYVGGDVDVRVGQTLVLGDHTQIAGNISYTSKGDLTRAQGAVVMGTINRQDFAPEKEAPRYQGLIIELLVLIFSGLSIFFVLRTRTVKFVHVLTQGYGRFGLIGLGMLLALPLVSVILVASGIGALVGLALMLSYVALILSALMFVPVVVGVLVQRLARLGESLTIFTVMFGACITLVLTQISVLGFFVLLFVFLAVVGVMCNEVYHFFKRV